MDAEISLQYPSARFARSVMNALAPDNNISNRRMRILANANGKSLDVEVRGCEKIETLQATVQDIFRCIRAAESSLTKLSCHR